MGFVGLLSLPVSESSLPLWNVESESDIHKSLWAPRLLGSPSIYHLCGCSDHDFEPPSQARRLSTGLIFEGIFSKPKVIETRTHHMRELGLFQKHRSGSFFQYRQTSAAFGELTCCWKQIRSWNFQDANLPSSRRKEWVFPKTRKISESSEWNPEYRRRGNREESIGQRQQNTIPYPWIHVKTQFQISGCVSVVVITSYNCNQARKGFLCPRTCPAIPGALLVSRGSLSVRTVISVRNVPCEQHIAFNSKVSMQKYSF